MVFCLFDLFAFERIMEYMYKSNVITIAVLIGILGVHIDVHAAMHQNASIEPAYFSVDTTLSGSGANSKYKNFSVNVIPQDARINTWKVRFFCDGKFTVSMPTEMENVCERAIDMTSTQIQNFKFTTSRQKGGAGLEPFSFKIKAYDAERQWLHTEEKVFRMR